MREQVAKLARGRDLAKAFNYILKRWASFTLFLEDGRVCLSNNAAERGLRTRQPPTSISMSPMPVRSAGGEDGCGAHVDAELA